MVLVVGRGGEIPDNFFIFFLKFAALDIQTCFFVFNFLNFSMPICNSKPVWFCKL